MSREEIIEVTRRLLDSVVASDWTTYSNLCVTDLTSFEPEAEGYLVEGMQFHKHYFDLEEQSPYSGVTTTISSPHVRVLGNVAVIAYVRVSQKTDEAGVCVTSTSRETRVWQQVNGEWKHVHFHRS